MIENRNVNTKNLRKPDLTIGNNRFLLGWEGFSFRGIFSEEIPGHFD